MIIISGGFPKSASTLLFLYTETFLSRSGKRSAQRAFRRYNEEGFIRHFGFFNTTRLVLLSIFRGNVVVKSHAAPNFWVKLLIGLGLAKAYYSVRDPRDVMLSALDHGEKARAKTNKTNSDLSFAAFHSRESLYEPLRMHYCRFSEWKRYGKVLFVRYEQLMQQPENELAKVLDWLGWKESKKSIPAVVAEFAAKKKETVHFNKGVVSRNDEYTPETLAEVERELQECIAGLGYARSNHA